MRSVWLSATIAQTRVSSFCMTHSFISVATTQQLLLLLPKRKDEGIITMATMGEFEKSVRKKVRHFTMQNAVHKRT